MTPEPQNLVNRVSLDPKLQKVFQTELEKPQLKIPPTYSDELNSYLKVQVTLVSTISGPDDYKTLMEAITVLHGARERVAEISGHLKSLRFLWGKIQNRAQRYVEKTFFDELNDVKDSIRKSVIATALLPLEEGVEELDFLVSLSDSVGKHLTEVNWTIKTSVEMLNNYFAAMKSIMPNFREV